MKSLYKYLITLVIGIILGASVVFYVDRCPEPVTTVVTKTDTIYKTVHDTTELVVTKYIKGETVILDLPDEDPMGMETGTTTPRETQKYTGKEELENGTIGYEIYADSLLAYKFDLETKETIINNTTTITNWDTRSRLFVGGGVDMNWVNKTPQEASIGLMYNRKQKWAISATINTDLSGLLPVENATSFGVKFWWGLGKRKQ